MANYLGIGGLDRDKDVITDIIMEVGWDIVQQDERVPKGFTYHCYVDKYEEKELWDLLNEAEDNGDILAYAWHETDWR